MPPQPRIELLMTGNELMSGDTIDANSATIAQRLGELALTVSRKTTLGDDLDQLCACLARATGEADVVIINGGLGPTRDDLTAEVVARVAGVPLVESPAAREHVVGWCHQRGITPNAANLKQALLPDGVDIIANPRGSAVGFAQRIGNCLVLTTPGVPGELRSMLDEVCKRVGQAVGRGGGSVLRLQTFGLGESTIQQQVAEQCPDWPAEVELGFRAGLPQVELKLSVTSPKHLPAQQAARAQLVALFGDHIIGEGNATLAGSLLGVLVDQGKTFTCAESCTGGQIAAMFTREPGASSAFRAGFVTYANSAKRDLLGVPESMLLEHGAVSEPVVRAMLAGALVAAEADIGVAVSGIAGPDGGSADKPVGTVWLAWGTREQVATRRLVIPMSREVFQTIVAAAGLDLMRRQLLGLPPLPDYISRRAV